MSAPWELSERHFLSEAEVRQLLVHVRSPINDVAVSQASFIDRLIIEGLLFSGLRNSEFCGLLLGDTVVGLGQSALRVRDTRKNDRLVYVPDSLSKLIEVYVRDIRPAKLPEGATSNDLLQPLVLNQRRRPYERTALYRRVVRILTAAALGSRASVQLLRHTYGYLAYKRSGGNLLFVQEQLGHAHPMVTAVYAKFVTFSYSDLANRVEPSESTNHPTNCLENVSCPLS